MKTIDIYALFNGNVGYIGEMIEVREGEWIITLLSEIIPCVVKINNNVQQRHYLRSENFDIKRESPTYA